MRRLAEIHITPRDLEVLKLLSEGLSNPEIATRMGIGVGTVKAHLYNMFRQMNLTGGGSGNRILLAAEYHRTAREMPLLAS